MERVDPSTIAPFFNTKSYSKSLTAAPSQLIVPANANRILIAISVSSVAVDLVPFQGNLTGQGLLIPPNSLPLIIKYSDWGGIVGGEWWGNAAAGTTTVFVVEVDYMPSRG